MLRSPHAHARILAVDATIARTFPGVVAVLTADDLAGIGDLPCDWVAPGMDVVPRHPVLARDRVRYAGEPIAAVAAETAYAAEDALAGITVTYEKLPAVADQEAAIKDGAPRLHDAVPNNIGLPIPPHRRRHSAAPSPKPRWSYADASRTTASLPHRSKAGPYCQISTPQRAG